MAKAPVWRIVMKTTSSPNPASTRLPAGLFVLAGLSTLIAGCASDDNSHVVSAPPPAAPTATAPVATVTTPATTTTTAPAYATTTNPSNTVVVTQAPPAPQAENVPERPSDRHVWIAGYWAWRDDRYEWISGHWTIPPKEGSTWVPPRWEQESDGRYRFYDGHWE